MPARRSAGRLCTSAVRLDTAGVVQQLSWLLLSAPLARAGEALPAAAAVTAAFWAAAAAEGWPVWEMPAVMAPALVQAVDAGALSRSACRIRHKTLPHVVHSAPVHIP